MQHFKYTPITHKHAWDDAISDITTTIGGEAIDFSGMCREKAAVILLSSSCWYKIEPCRIVDISEAYRVLKRGGMVRHKECDDEAQLGEDGEMWWRYKWCKPVMIKSSTIDGWIVLNEGERKEE
jgi:hypothetical protein